MKTILNSKIILFLFLSLLIGCEKKQSAKPPILQIVSVPSGATVYINQKEIGQTPLKLKVPPRDYLIKLTRKDYKPHWERVICRSNRTKAIEVAMVPVTASVMIRSVPSGVSVIMNGNQIGETPLTLHEQPVGKYTALLTKPNFVTREITWKVSDSRPQLININLTTNVGTLNVSSIPSGARVYIDGAASGTTPFKRRIEEGGHKIRLEMEGYAQYKEVVFVERGKKKSVQVTLTRLPGQLAVTSRPSGAIVYIDDRQYGKTPVTIDSLNPGNYKLKLEKSNYDVSYRDVSIHPGKKTEISVRLDTNMGGIDLIVNPPGVTIYLDGKKVGSSQPGETKNLSKVFELRNVSSGRHTVKIAHKRATPHVKDFTINVRKGKITRLRKNMWIADVILKLKDGTVSNGRIRSENKEELIFEHSPTIRQRYGRKEIKSITPLRYEE